MKPLSISWYVFTVLPSLFRALTIVDVGGYQRRPNLARTASRILPRDCGAQGKFHLYKCAGQIYQDGLQPFVTELDLRLAQLSSSAIEYLREVLPSSENEAGEPEYDYETWLQDVFA